MFRGSTTFQTLVPTIETTEPGVRKIPDPMIELIANNTIDQKPNLVFVLLVNLLSSI